MKRKTEREKFEAWARSRALDLTPITAPGNGYCGIITAFAWYAWQAAKRQAARERRGK